jgi:hypothetical protein
MLKHCPQVKLLQVDQAFGEEAVEQEDLMGFQSWPPNLRHLRLPWVMLNGQMPTGLVSFSITGLDSAEQDVVVLRFHSVTHDIIELSLVDVVEEDMPILVDAFSIALPRLRRFHLCHASMNVPTLQVSDLDFDAGLSHSQYDTVERSTSPCCR